MCKSIKHLCIERMNQTDDKYTSLRFSFVLHSRGSCNEWNYLQRKETDYIVLHCFPKILVHSDNLSNFLLYYFKTKDVCYFD